MLAATATQTLPVGQYTFPLFACASPASCTPVPIDLGVDTPISLTIYGTGIRGWASSGTALNTTVTIGSQSLPAAYAGPQPTVPGLDQVNVALPLSLRGAGLINVSVTAAGVTSNIGQIYINWKPPAQQLEGGLNCRLLTRWGRNRRAPAGLNGIRAAPSCGCSPTAVHGCIGRHQRQQLPVVPRRIAPGDRVFHPIRAVEEFPADWIRQDNPVRGRKVSHDCETALLPMSSPLKPRYGVR